MTRFFLALSLTACTLDPEAPLRSTELQVTVVGLTNERSVRIVVRRETTELAAFAPPVTDDRLDVWFTDLPVGALTLEVLTAEAECALTVMNLPGPQQQLVDLTGPCPGAEGGEGDGDRERPEGEDFEDEEGHEEGEG